MGDLAAHLVRSGILAPEAASRALGVAEDGDVASAVLRLGLAPEQDLVRALCDLHDCPGVDLSRSVVPTANLDVVAAVFCRQRRILPVSVGRGEIVLAVADPDDRTLADELRFVTGRKILRYVAVPASIERALEALVRERSRAGLAWRGPDAPSLPDRAAAWVGVVFPTRNAVADEADLPEPTTAIELVRAAGGRTPFAAPSPARRTRPPQHEPPQLEAVPRGAATIRLAGAGAGKLAVVADASPEGRRELADLLGGLGCTVLEAADGRAALDLVRESRPDLVVLEALLPKVPGFEVCRAVKGDPILRPTQVVLTSSAHRGTVAADARIAFGADAFLERPLRADEARRMFRRVLLGPAGDPADQAVRAAAIERWGAGARLLAEGRLEEAAVALREAVARDELAPEAHYYLGHALARQGLLFEAAAAYARAAELRPDVEAPHRHLAHTYEQLGFLRSAREAWARAIEVCRDEEIRRTMQARLARLLGG
ncbi:MAG TPA: response regulator [Anaeromyxobacteraceae bacterium]|nr:response regulator [Anaeromyxobacteraceae bacterium]